MKMMKKRYNEKREPKLVLVMGAVCAGKTTHRTKNYTAGYSSIDAGDIFIELSNGEYFDFPSHLESEMNNIGLKKMKEAIQSRDSIVLELIGSNQESVEDVIELSKKIGYKSSVVQLTCGIEEAKRRNNSRGDDNISAYYCEAYHIDWFKQIATES